MKKFLLLGLLALGPLACGSSNGGGDNIGQNVSEVAISNGSAQLGVAVVPAVLQLTIETAVSSLLAQNGDDDDEFDCTAPSGGIPSGPFEVDCTCEGGGTIKVSFNDGITESNCSSNGTTGTTYDINTTGTTVYTNCSFDECEQTVVINGADTFTAQGTVNECTNVATVTETVETALACGGVQATSDGVSFDVGYTINATATGSLTSLVLAQTTGDDEEVTADGTFCQGGDSFNFTSLSDFASKADPNDLCSENDTSGGGSTGGDS